MANGIGLNERWLWNTVYNLSKFHSSLLLLLYSVDAFVVLLRSAFIANHENDYRPWTWWVFCVSACMSRTFCFKWMSKPFQNPLNLKYTNQIITNHQTYETWCIRPTNQPTHFTQFNHNTQTHQVDAEISEFWRETLTHAFIHGQGAKANGGGSMWNERELMRNVQEYWVKNCIQQQKKSSNNNSSLAQNECMHCKKTRTKSRIAQWPQSDG